MKRLSRGVDVALAAAEGDGGQAVAARETVGVETAVGDAQLGRAAERGDDVARDGDGRFVFVEQEGLVLQVAGEVDSGGDPVAARHVGGGGAECLLKLREYFTTEFANMTADFGGQFEAIGHHICRASALDHAEVARAESAVLFDQPEPAALVQPSDGETRDRDGRDSGGRIDSGVACPTVDDDADAITAVGPDGDLLPGAAVPVEALLGIAEVRETDVLGALQADLFLDAPQERNWWMGKTLRQDFDGGREDGGGPGSVVGPERGFRVGRANDLAIDRRLATLAQRHRVDVSHQQATRASDGARQREDEVADLAAGAFAVELGLVVADRCWIGTSSDELLPNGSGNGGLSKTGAGDRHESQDAVAGTAEVGLGDRSGHRAAIKFREVGQLQRASRRVRPLLWQESRRRQDRSARLFRGPTACY